MRLNKWCQPMWCILLCMKTSQIQTDRYHWNEGITQQWLESLGQEWKIPGSTPGCWACCCENELITWFLAPSAPKSFKLSKERYLHVLCNLTRGTRNLISLHMMWKQWTPGLKAYQGLNFLPMQKLPVIFRNEKSFDQREIKMIVFQCGDHERRAYYGL